MKGAFPDNDKEGIECTGEPAMDPSRMVMDDGIDSEYLSDFWFGHYSAWVVYIGVLYFWDMYRK